MTSGKFLRKGRWVSTWAKPRSATGAAWKARSTSSRLLRPAWNFFSKAMASIEVTCRACHGAASRARGNRTADRHSRIGMNSNNNTPESDGDADLVSAMILDDQNKLRREI